MSGARKLACAIVLCSLAACVEAPIPADVVVKNVSVYSGAAEAPFIASVAVRDGKFLAIGPPGDVSFAADDTIDGSGRFMTPGLWDAHAHVRSSMDRGLDVGKFIEFGVTSIHDLGGLTERVKQVERDIANGTIQGPRIYPAYFMLNGKSFADHQRAVSTEAEISSAVDELVAAGAAQIKVHRALSPDMLPVVIRLAHEHGLKVTGHIPLGMHPLDACAAGMDSVEHVGSFVEAVASVAPDGDNDTQAAMAYLLSEAAEPVFECLAARMVVVTPTVSIYPEIARRRSNSDQISPEFAEMIEMLQRLTYRLYASGATLLTGTDTSDAYDPVRTQPGASVRDEMLMLEAAGVPPVKIIAMATLHAANAIGAGSRTGSIEVGKDADFLLLSADPGRTVGNFQSIYLVYRMGREVFRAP